MRNEDITRAIKNSCFALWPDRHLAGLSKALHCPKSTANSWIRGHRRMPAASLEFLAELLKHRAEMCKGLADQLFYFAKIRAAEPRKPRGFEVLRDRDGSGIARDGRRRGCRHGTASTARRPYT